MSEIIFEVREDEGEGGYTAAALGYGIHTQAESLEELRAMVREAVECYFEDAQQAPRTASTTSNTSRVRFSKLPPYSSVR